MRLRPSQSTWSLLVLLFIVWLFMGTMTAAAQDHESHDVFPVLSLHLLNTSIAALNVGMSYPRSDTWASYWSGAASAEVGVAGGQLNLGVGRHFPPNTDWGGPGGDLSLRVQGTILRTWGSPWHVEPGQSFVGVELQGMLFLVGTRVGYYHRIAGSVIGDESFVSAGLILGYQ